MPDYKWNIGAFQGDTAGADYKWNIGADQTDAPLMNLEGTVQSYGWTIGDIKQLLSFVGTIESYGSPTGVLSPTFNLINLSGSIEGLGYTEGTLKQLLSLLGTIQGQASAELTLKVLAWFRVLTVLNEGTAGQVLKTDGAGSYYWSNI